LRKAQTVTRPDDPKAHLLEFLDSLRPARKASGDPLAQLDSLGILQLVTYLETTYGMNLAKCRVEPDDLRSLAGILGIIARYSA
jgi:acyl carrier protein